MNDEWIKGDDKETNYHLGQYSHPKAYTLFLKKFASDLHLFEPKMSYLDAACGCGAVTKVFKDAFPESRFIGLDINPKYIRLAVEHCKENRYIADNLLNTQKIFKGQLQGIFCLQTISWLESYDEVLKSFFKTKPDWILLTSLFYDGLVDAQIKITDWTKSVAGKKGRQTFYNIYSIPRFTGFAEKNGYRLDCASQFQLSIDLDRPSDKGMGTYTLKRDTGERIQVSGPLMMPWYTVVLRKIV